MSATVQLRQDTIGCIISVNALNLLVIRQSVLRSGSTTRASSSCTRNEIGEPYKPAVLSRYWRDAVEKAAEIRHIKLHAARHTCATLMHLQGVPVAVIAAWIGHKDAEPDDAALRALAGRRLEGRR